jgi:hypothetical protein
VELLVVRLLLSVSNAVSSSSSLSPIRKAFGRTALSIKSKLRTRHRLRNNCAMVPRIFGRVIFFDSFIFGGVNDDADVVDCGVGVTGVDMLVMLPAATSGT